MANVDVGGGRFKRAGLMVFVLTLAVGLVLVGWRAQMRAASARRLAWLEARARLAALQTLQGQLRHPAAALEVLGALSRQNGGPIPNFQEAGAHLRAAWPDLVTLELQPGGVVGEVVPKTGYERALGLNVFKDPAQTPGAWAAVRGRAATLTAPVRLYRGETGVVLRGPIFRRERDGRENFWGFVAVSLAMTPPLAQARPEELDRALQLELGAQPSQTTPSLPSRDRWFDVGILALEGLAVLVLASLLGLLVNLLNTESLQERLDATVNDAQAAARAFQTEIGQVRAALRQAQETIRQLRTRPEPAVRLEPSAPAKPAPAPAPEPKRATSPPPQPRPEPVVRSEANAPAAPAPGPLAEVETLAPPASQPAPAAQVEKVAPPRKAPAPVLDPKRLTNPPTQPLPEPVVRSEANPPAAPAPAPLAEVETLAPPQSQPAPAAQVEQARPPQNQPLPEPAAQPTPPEAPVQKPSAPAPRPKGRPATRRKKTQREFELDLFATPSGSAEAPVGIVIGGSEATGSRPGSVGAAEDEATEQEPSKAHRPGPSPASPEEKDRRPSRETAAGKSAPLDVAQLRKAANQILPLLAGQDPGARDCLADNRSVFQAALPGGACAEFEQSIRKRDFDSAQEQLKRAMKRHGLL